MLAHPRFGPLIRNWRDFGAIPRRAKWMACGGMAFGYASFWFAAQPGVWLATGVALFMIGSAAYVATRPEGSEVRETAAPESEK